MFLRISIIANIILIAISLVLYNKLQTKTIEIENKVLQCNIEKVSANNTILKNNIAELDRIRNIEIEQHKKFLESNNELINQHIKIANDFSNINTLNNRLLDIEAESRRKTNTTDTTNNIDTQAIHEYATIREKLHTDCRNSLIEVSEDATRLQQKVLEFDKLWDLQEDSIKKLIDSKSKS